MEQLEPSYTAGGNLKQGSPFTSKTLAIGHKSKNSYYSAQQFDF